MRLRPWVSALLAVALASCSSGAPAADAQTAAPVEGPGYVQVAKYPHDPEAFTQGLEFRGTALFEGTGLTGGRSSLRRVDYETGEVLRQVNLADHLFGEGITIMGRRIYQITWQNGRCFVYDRKTFKRVKRFSYEGEGWGLTHADGRLIMSDGTATIRFRDPATFEVVDEIEVTENGEPVALLNELEWVNGEIFANVWQTDEVVRIDPATGEVVGRLDLTALRQQEDAEGAHDVTNGIAYMKAEDRLFVTGKLWRNLYEIELTDLVP
ncbi:MAG TPA: glutaminyl-peptide cyclotransferase [Actinomycetota bacterium]|nr:glutaminyl-peptide cyclotransferase [Actinomycetota bacterium]